MEKIKEYLNSKGVTNISIVKDDVCLYNLDILGNYRKNESKVWYNFKFKTVESDVVTSFNVYSSSSNCGLLVMEEINMVLGYIIYYCGKDRKLQMNLFVYFLYLLSKFSTKNLLFVHTSEKSDYTDIITKVPNNHFITDVVNKNSDNKQLHCTIYLDKLEDKIYEH